MHKAVVLGVAHGHIISTGNLARETEGVELIGVWDDDPSRRAEGAKKLGAPEIETLESALEAQPDVVLVGAVPCDRAALVERALEAGAAAIVDKPLAVTHEALDSLIETQRRTGRPVMVLYSYRANVKVQSAKAAVEAGRIGRLVRIFSAGPHKLSEAGRPAWHFTRAENGGALIDIGSHHVDVCCWFAGGAPEWLCAMHGNFSQPSHPEFQDFAQLQMRFADGVLAHVEVDWLNPESMRHFGDTRMWLQGTEGKIELRLGDEVSARIWTHESADQPLDEIDAPAGKQWTRKMLLDLASGGPGPIPQDEIWRASRLTLHAFDSAEEGGLPMNL